MSTALRVSLSEYDHIVACGAFDAINRKIELIRGEIVEMSPAGPVHDDLIEYLREWSFRFTDQAAIKVRGQTGMNLPQLDSRPEPDVFWVKAKRYLDAHPSGPDTLLVIEVADSSLQSDRSPKAELYAEAGIQEFWIVDVQGECVHVMREIGTGGRYGWQRTAAVGDLISPIAQPTAILNIADLFGLN